ncbi:MAG: TetR/AcrR family transcriptional regulator [Chloroflexi bacterium]|nr:TetR/AcrR family transcriptional regulator [Chloroflexota bacterium]
MERATLLFMEKGYDRASVRDIARACGFEPASIYNYFPNKEALLFEVLRNEIERFMSAVRYLESDEAIPPVEQLRLFITNHLILGLSKPCVCALFDVELRNLSSRHRKAYVQLRDSYEGVLCRIIQRGIDGGVLNQVDVKLAAYAILSMLIRARMWYSSDGRLVKDEIAGFMVDFALNGLTGKTRSNASVLSLTAKGATRRDSG